MKKFLAYTLFLFFSVIGNGNAQFRYMGWGYEPTVGRGFYTGYQKETASEVLFKQRFQRVCTKKFHFPAAIGNNVSEGPDIFPKGLQPVLLIHNQDSFTKATQFVLANGYYIQNIPRKTARLVREGCDSCRTFQNSADFLKYNLRYPNEFYFDTSLLSANLYPNTYNFEIDSFMNSLTFVQGLPPLYAADSLSYFLKNIVPFLDYTSQIHSRELNTARVFRWQEYSEINSPEPTNPNSIVAVKNKPLTYNPGIIDIDHDSIHVSHLQPQILESYQFPDVAISPTFPPLTTAQQQHIKQVLKDSILNVPYHPGYSFTQPFGVNAPYTLNPKNGEITFTPQQEGLYLLAYRIEEYRDGKLLGDVMNYRIAYVIDSNITLPEISEPLAKSSGIVWNPTEQEFILCPNQLLTYTVKATSALSTAKIILSTNAQQSAQGVSVSYAGQGTDSATITYTWTPTQADAGIHYIYTDAVDTACGPGHMAIHQSRGVKIRVMSQLKITASKPVACAGKPVSLSAGGGYHYQWSVLPGGDTTLPCKNCQEIKVDPSKTTSYVLSGTHEHCGTKADTFTLHYLPPFSIQAGKDTTFGGGIPAGYLLSVSVHPAAGYYQYLWEPAGKVSDPYSAHPEPGAWGSHNRYIVTVKDSFGCYERKDTVNIYVYPTGVDDGAVEGVLRIHPNPFKNSFMVSVQESGVLRVRTLEGKEVAFWKLERGSQELLFPEALSASTYIAWFETEKGAKIYTGKIVKE